MPISLTMLSAFVAIVAALTVAILVLAFAKRRSAMEVIRLRDELQLATELSQAALQEQNHADNQLQLVTAKLDKQLARVEPLQLKYDELQQVCNDLRSELATTKQQLLVCQERSTQLKNQLSAKCSEAEHLIAMAEKVTEERDRAVATAKRQVAKMDRIMEVMDPSSTGEA